MSSCSLGRVLSFLHWDPSAVKAVCIENSAFIGGDRERGVGAPRPSERADLTVGRTYAILEEDRGMYRVVDDSGDDFLYPKRMFRVVSS